jgi:phosphoglycolate phosphatase
MLLIFDWDGTLCDSKEKITLSMQMAAEDLGWDRPAAEAVHNIIGLGLPEAISSLYPNVNAEGRQALRDAYALRFVELDLDQPSKLFPGVEEGLIKLREAGHQLAIATGKSRKGLDRIFTAMQLNQYFHATRCADETASKPNPLMLEQLLAEFSQTPENALMMGDTEYDLDMASRIQMPSVAVSYGAHHISRLHPYKPILCVDHFSELVEWLEAEKPD